MNNCIHDLPHYVNKSLSSLPPVLVSVWPVWLLNIQHDADTLMSQILTELQMQLVCNFCLFKKKGTNSFSANDMVLDSSV